MNDTTAMLEPAIEAMPAPEMTALHQRVWPAQWDYVRHHSTFYRDKFGDVASASVPLDRLSELPLTDKGELRDSVRRRPPCGDHLACDETQVRRLHRTSGTTGGAINIAWTERDARLTAQVGARALFAADHMLELGLVNWVVEPEDVLERAIAIAQRIVDQTDPDSTSRFKQMVHSGPDGVEEALDLEEQATIESFVRPASRSASSARRKQFEQRPDSGAH